MGWNKPSLGQKISRLVSRLVKFDRRWRTVNPSFFEPSFPSRSFPAHTLKYLYDTNISAQAKFNTFT